MIHLIIPNPAVHFHRCKLHVELGKGGTQRRCSKTQSAVWMTNNRNGSTEMKHQKCSIQDNSLPLLLLWVKSHQMECAMGLAGLRFRCFGILRSGLSFAHVRKRGPHMSAGGREGGELRWEELQRGLLSQRINTEQGMWGERSMPTIRCCGSHTQIPSPFAKYSINVTTGQTEASWWKDWINLGSVTLWRDTKRDLVWRGLA